jgi:hypothetical protein
MALFNLFVLHFSIIHNSHQNDFLTVFIFRDDKNVLMVERILDFYLLHKLFSLLTIKPSYPFHKYLTKQLMTFSEITRDSGSERGNSLDISEEELDISKSAVKKRTESHSAKGQARSISPASPSASVSPTDKVSNGRHGGHSREASPHMESHVTSDLQYKNERNTSNHVPADPRRRLYPESHASNKNSNGSHHEHGSGKPHRRSPGQGSPRNSPQRVSPQRVSPRGDHSPHRDLRDSKTYSDSNANDMSQGSTVSDGRLDNSGVHHVPHLDLSDCDDSGDVDSISGEINPPIEDNRIRLFVALFDYDPESMSPNVECLDEELPFKEGQIIKVNRLACQC